jgi:hypothetical protein
VIEQVSDGLVEFWILISLPSRSWKALNFFYVIGKQCNKCRQRSAPGKSATLLTDVCQTFLRRVLFVKCLECKAIACCLVLSLCMLFLTV